MSFIRAKKIGHKEYLYRVESYREGKTVRQRILEYLGPKEDVDLEKEKKRIRKDDAKRRKARKQEHK
jgi:hypothetical protein